MLQRVPPCMEHVKAEGASTSSSKLLLAVESFETRDIRSACWCPTSLSILHRFFPLHKSCMFTCAIVAYGVCVCVQARR